MDAKTCQVANYFLEKARLEGHSLTLMQLQKFLYFAHGWSWAILKKPLINEPIQAWKYGPVIPSLYHAAKEFGGGPVTKQLRADQDSFFADLKDEELQVLDYVWETYKGLSGAQLSALTHQSGSPWARTYQDDERFSVISEELIRKDFDERLKSYTAEDEAV